ncbi:Transcriptional regulator [Moritella viscosa]|uniref:winged helix-turn-helix transcriptional regulator n=1 Tax=Moritella viscosa TaxID=80854 RepID=UPI000508F2E7|nr:helix-turn-helix domain-containing protein [Moritella viscosa]CED61059.1 transcriptional regulator, HxlR family [Moritella viscosa]SHO10573.1 Transcriptional regulator [Moritella viscosa]SHO22657.1 Transcriptional regulator [Moritella viscosa]
MKTTIETMANGQKKVINSFEEPCSVERGMRMLGGKWKASILWHLQDEPVRFNDLSRMLGGASKKMVDQRLKELESQGLVIRKVISDRPIAVTYEITEFGRTALDILKRLKDWSEEHGI